MKLNNITDIDEFFEVIDKCEGTIELVSNEGDRINLKSKLTQYVARTVFSDLVDELELVAHNPNDARMLLDYMMGK